MWLRYRSSVCVVLAACSTGVPGALGCGPFFPNSLLGGGDDAVLEAPVANFRLEIAHIEWRAAEWENPTNVIQDAPTTAEADVAEVREALETSDMPATRKAEVITAYAEMRDELASYLTARRAWTPTQVEFVHDDDGARLVEFTVPPPPKPRLRVPKGVPAEFALYCRGALAYHDGQPSKARDSWQAVLNLPAESRRHRSTWAAFMLGKLQLDHDDPRAARYFQQVRQLAKEGYSDSLRLAVDSLGWEAKAELNQGHYERAIELYFSQQSAGDTTAAVSLELVARELMKEDSTVVQRVARHPLCRQMMVAWLISREFHEVEWAQMWLEAVEKSGARDVRGADRLAWAAYQVGDMDGARRWMARASEKKPTTQWIRTKLLLRDGRVDEAINLLSNLVRSFPDVQDWDGAYKVTGPFSSQLNTTVDEVTGELAVLKLSRGQFVEALDLLYGADYSFDAAYLAERVLTTDELIAYVNRRWPENTEQQIFRTDLRYLLARRLARAGRWADAKPYFPPSVSLTFDSYARAMESAKDCALSDEECAEWLWEAAKITRWWGMSLTGTEVEPDWHAVGGDYELESMAGSRREDAELVPPTGQEKGRAAHTQTEPNERFHYRYLAAQLAWQAAELLPDDSDATAQVLCEAGSWLKYRDPSAADRFYKALVLRCRHTELGQEADHRRWFPPISDAEMPETIEPSH